MLSDLAKNTLVPAEKQCYVPVALLRALGCDCVVPSSMENARLPGWYLGGMLLGKTSPEAARTLSKMLLALWEAGLLSHYCRRFVQANVVNLNVMSSWNPS
jgi:hypothetical protein